MKPTPIKWLLEQLKVCNYISKKGHKNAETWLIQEALEYEQEQQDEFAIGFAEFSINYNYHPMHKVWIRYDKMANEKFTTKELLEIYKKECNL
jgi:hypothetical protein